MAEGRVRVEGNNQLGSIGLCLTPALTFYPLPPGEEIAGLDDSRFGDDYPANSVMGFQNGGGRFSLSSGESSSAGYCKTPNPGVPRPCSSGVHSSQAVAYEHKNAWRLDPDQAV